MDAVKHFLATASFIFILYYFVGPILTAILYGINYIGLALGNMYAIYILIFLFVIFISVSFKDLKNE